MLNAPEGVVPEEKFPEEEDFPSFLMKNGTRFERTDMCS